MAPRITSWDDLSYVSEARDPGTGQILHTSFMIIDNSDSLYYGQLEGPRARANFDRITHVLKRVPDDEIFPKWPAPGMKLTQAPETLTVMIHIKRPPLDLYEILKEHNQLHQLSEMLLAEAQVMEMLSQYPHPNIIRYYGCRVMRGYITGLVMDRHAHDLNTYLKDGVGTLDKILS